MRLAPSAALPLLVACAAQEPAEPTAVQVSIEGPAWGLRELRCRADGNAPLIARVWVVDGEDTPFVDERLPVTAIRPGERWSCRVTVSGPDGRTVTAGAEPYEVPTPIGGNVLLLLLDDVGIDKIGAYDAHPKPARTPRIDRLAAGGVRFETFYAQPSCSIARSQLLTGRSGLRTGFRETITLDNEDFALPDEETVIAEVLAPPFVAAPWTTGVFGKWHLVDRSLFTAESVTRQGFGTFQGTVANVVGDYYGWEQYWADGTVSRREGYSTTAIVDDVLAWVADAPEPWFAWTAFHAAHEPLHIPPPELTTTWPIPGDPSADLVDAMVEAADTEIGRLLDTIDPELLARTTVVLMADNGTASHAIRPPLDPSHAKSTVHEAGVRAPLIIAGYAVEGPPRTSSAMVHIVDLFPTIADLAGVPLAGDASLSLVSDPPVALDGVSILPLLRDPDAVGARTTLFASTAHPNGPPPWERSHETVRDADWKYVVDPGRESLYLLPDDGSLREGPNLLAAGPLTPDAEAARQRLSEVLERIRATPYSW